MLQEIDLILKLSKDKKIYKGFLSGCEIIIRRVPQNTTLWMGEIKFVSGAAQTLNHYSTKQPFSKKKALNAILTYQGLPSLIGIVTPDKKRMSLYNIYKINIAWVETEASYKEKLLESAVSKPNVQNSQNQTAVPAQPRTKKVAKQKKSPVIKMAKRKKRGGKFSWLRDRCPGRSNIPECDKSGACAFCRPGGRADLFSG